MSNQSLSPPSRLSLRLTGEERLALEETAGGTTLSAYIREQLFGEHSANRKRGSDRPVKDHESLARILAMLGRSDLASSLAVIAKAAQSGAFLWDEDSAATLDACRTELSDIRALLMKALRVKSD